MTQLTINTTQNVNINFTAASVGERILALLVDLLIEAAYLITIMWGVFYGLGLADAIKELDPWSKAAVIVLFFLPVMFYTLFFESIFEGQTLGKKLLQIKVVKIDGYQAGFGDYVIRWLLRLVDVFSVSGLVGLISIIVTEKLQRLGDIAAGTAVITLKNNVSINSTILVDIDQQYVPIYPGVIKLSDNDMRIIKETFQNAVAARDFSMIEKLRNKIEAVTCIKNQSGNDKDFIKTVLKDYNFYTQNM